MWLFLVPIVLLIISFLVWLGQSPDEVQVPEELVGMTYEDAVELLSEYSLSLGETIEEIAFQKAGELIHNFVRHPAPNEILHNP